MSGIRAPFLVSLSLVAACADARWTAPTDGGAGGGGGAGGQGGLAGTAGSAGTEGYAGVSGNAGATGGAGRGGPGGGRGGGSGGFGTGSAGVGGMGGRGGASGTSGTSGGRGGAGGGSGGVAGAAAGTGGRGGGTAGLGGGGSGGGCATDLAARVRITEVDLGIAYAYNEVDNNGPNLGLTPLAISAVPGGGSRVAFLGKSDGMVHVVALDAGDQLVAGSGFGLPGYDVQDIHADATGGVLLISRAAMGGASANNNCGDISHLCGLAATYPTAASCYDMYMVRFDGTGETWAAKLTDTSPTLPAYGTSAAGGGNVVFIWSQYAHNGRIASDGSSYAGYFGAAIAVPGQACQGSSTFASGVNIHQGDRMKVVSAGGTVQSGGFDWGCSHSGFERVVWDPAARRYVAVCKNDAAAGGKSGRIAFPPSTTIYPVDLSYSNLGSVTMAGGGGYWIITSDIRSGQPANANGLADIRLLHVPGMSSPAPDQNLTLVSDGLNDRAPHLVPYGTGQLLAAWETSTVAGDLSQSAAARQMWLQVLDATTGAAPAGAYPAAAGPLKLTPNVLGSRYQDFRPFPDGSVAYPAPGSSGTKVKILRVLPCS